MRQRWTNRCSAAPCWNGGASCLRPASTNGIAKKRKYHFRLPGQDRLYLAGLWNTFQGEERFVVLTTAPNDTIINVHDRMPVLLLHDTGMASAK